MGRQGIVERFSRARLGRFVSELLERRRLLMSDLQAQEAADPRDGFERPSLSTQSADIGADREAAEFRLGRREAESTEVREIDDALERIRDGSFGGCEECGKAVSEERLEAIPYARLCLPCKKDEEA